MKIKSALIILLCVGLISTKVTAQESELNSNNVYDFNHFSFEFQNGLSKTLFEKQSGNKQFDSRTGYVHLFSMAYQFNLHKYFGLQVKAGIGFQSFAYYLEPNGIFRGSEGWPYRFLVQYSSFSRLGLSASYHRQFNDSKWGVEGSAGGGFSFFGGQDVSSGSSYQTDIGLQNQYDLSYKYANRPQFLLDGSFGITRELKSRDLLGLYLTGEYYFNSIMSGTYQLHNYTSSGTILNNGSNIGFKLKYSFTRSRKMAKIADLRTESPNHKSANQQYRSQKRNTDPKNVFITAGSGLFFGRNNTKGSLLQVMSSAAPSWVHFVRFEKGNDNNYFYEGGISVEEYWSSFKMKDILTVQTTEFISSTASFGYGKRLIRKKTNWNFLTISAGAAMSARLDFIDYGFSSSSISYAPFDGTIESTGINSKSPVFFSLYGSLTHDLRLSKRLLLSLSYRFHQGLNTTIEETALFETTVGKLEDNLTRKINGTSNTFSIGLKYRLSD